MNRAPAAPALATSTLDEPERLARLRLARTSGIGPQSFRQAIEHHGSAQAALPRLAAAARRGHAVAPPSTAEIEDERARLAALGAALLVWGDADYPPLLAAIADPPPVLSVLGDIGLLHRRMVAIVGARNASAAGRRFAEELAADLGEAGLVVASGLARGIDTAAHRGALRTGTVAAMAGGVDVIYPPENAGLHEAMRGRGALLSEVPPGTEPRARHFPRRNRIIAGLALGTVVIEAAIGSGSLITARCALEEGREVMAVPGFPSDARARGGNELIRNGAALIEGAADVLAALPAAPAPRPRRTLPLFDAPEAPPATPVTAPATDATTDPGTPDATAAVLALLSPAPVSVDELVRRCHLSAAQLTAVLLDLELEGRIERHPGSRVSLV